MLPSYDLRSSRGRPPGANGLGPQSVSDQEGDSIVSDHRPPLDGVRVIDLSIYIQGPQAAQTLGDMGAEVIKVELPDVGDLARHITLAPGDPRSALYFAMNRNKRSVTLDIRTEAGRQAFLRIVEWADVLITNFRPGTLEAWGYGYETLAALNPTLIYAVGSAFGSSGPDADREGADLSAQCAGGLMAAIGADGDEPSPVATPVADHVAAQNLTSGILAALYARQRTRRGQMVEGSLLGGQIYLAAGEYTYASLTGKNSGRANRGHPLLRGIYRIFPTKDGWIGIVGVPSHAWPSFCRAIEREDLIHDDRYNALILSPENLATLVAFLDEIFPTKTTTEWCERLRANDQRYAPVRDHLEVLADPQAWQNGYFQTVEHPEWGTLATVASPLKLSDTPLQSGTWAAELGQHTEEVLVEVGFTWDEIIRLREAGAW